ncbi:MAG: superoxide dismutase family protein [Coxiellaceae bacterium]|nr:superoxide dismutase family protein [Coxiellaceae bacterium]
MKLLTTLALSLITATAFAHNKPLIINMHLLNGQNTSIGTVTATDTDKGLKLTPNLHGLPPGYHGFHVHVNPDCGNKGMAAGGHFDPLDTKQHLGPYKYGHRGDLPRLGVNKKGDANTPMVAPHLTVDKIKDHSLMIHLHGDNYADVPKPLGGGGPRLACGVIH